MDDNVCGGDAIAAGGGKGDVNVTRPANKSGVTVNTVHCGRQSIEDINLNT